MYIQIWSRQGVINPSIGMDTEVKMPQSKTPADGIMNVTHTTGD